MSNKNIRFLIAFSLMIACFLLIHPYQVQAKTVNPGHVMYETDGSTGFSMRNSNTVECFAFGDGSIGTFRISGDIISKGTYVNEVAYSANDPLTFEYYYSGHYNSEEKEKWNIVDDDEDMIDGISLDTEVGEGLILVQKSSDGVNWLNIGQSKEDYFAKSHISECSLYTVTLDELKEGAFYRVLVAYSMRKKTGSEEGIVFDADVFAVKRFVEKYQFYLCTETNYTIIRDLQFGRDATNDSVVRKGFYIDMNGCSDIVKVSKNDSYEHVVANYDCFTDPGEYKITTISKLGREYYRRITVYEGLSTMTISPTVSECKEKTGYTTREQKNGLTSYGIRNYSELKIAQPSGKTITKTTYKGFDAYGVNGDFVNFFLTLNYPLNLEDGEWCVNNSKWGSKSGQMICGVQTGEMGTGAFLVLKSSSGEEGTWVSAEKTRYAAALYTSDYGNHYACKEPTLVYVPDGEGVKKGQFFRVMYAFQVYNEKEKKYIDCLEEYSFYLFSNNLDAVTFPNESMKTEQNEQQVFGDLNENEIKIYKSIESLKDGMLTFSGFSVNRAGNPTVQYSIKKDGKEIPLSRDHKYTASGKYDIQLTNPAGNQRTVTIYVDRSSSEQAFKKYFGEEFIVGKRVYSEDSPVPVYEGGVNTTYNLSRVSDSFMPIRGQIRNVVTNDIIEITESRDSRSGSLKTPGMYEANFVVGSIEGGDYRSFTLSFAIIAEGTAPGPIINKENLDKYAASNVSDYNPTYYAVTFPSAGKGYITYAFRNRQDAVDFAYDFEKNSVEIQSDGTYLYVGHLYVKQKEKYDSLWDLTDAMQFFANEAVTEEYFDLSQVYTYLTLRDDDISNIINLRTLELEYSVVIFADGQKEKLALMENLPIISEKPYAYLTPGLGGTITKNFSDFKFISDKYGCDSYSVVITDCSGKEYPIKYGEGVGAQLRENGCPSGIVQITEKTKWGDSNSYKAVYIAPNDNTAKVILKCYDSENERTVSLSSEDQGKTIEVDAFAIEEVIDSLDPNSLVLVTKDGKEFYTACSRDILTETWFEEGSYVVKVVNRVGYAFDFEINVRESDCAIIRFVGDGTEDLKDIITTRDTKNVPLEQLSQSGYVFLGYQDQQGNKYVNNIDVNFTGILQLESIWKPKTVDLIIKDSLGNVLSESNVDYGTQQVLTVPKLQHNQVFVGWQINGKEIDGDSILVDREEKMIVTCLTREKYADIEDMNRSWLWILGIVVMLGLGCFGYGSYRKQMKKVSNEDEKE